MKFLSLMLQLAE